MKAVCLSLALALAAVSAVAQVSVFVPDNNPAAGAACNVIPFGSSASFAPGYTYAARVPASYLNAAATKLDEVWFAPCGTGTWSAPNCIVAVGHVPTPLPCPFTFPSGGSIGSFLDLTIIHDSAVQGPFSWNATQYTWSPLGFAAGGGTSFCWNQNNDIAFFITFQNSTIASASSWSGSCYRSATEPSRSYSAGWQAPASTTCNSATGLKMQLDFSACSPALPSVTPVGQGCGAIGAAPPILSSTQLPSFGNVGFFVDVTQAPPFAPTWLFASVGLAAVPTPLANGCLVYLDLPSMLILIAGGFTPTGPIPTGPGGATSILFPIYPLPGLIGTHVGLQAVLSDAGSGAFVGVTNALDLLIN